MISCLFQLVSTGAILWVRSLRGVDGWLDTALLIVAVVSVLLILPVFAVLKQRIKEIDGGEEEDAAIY